MKHFLYLILTFLALQGCEDNNSVNLKTNIDLGVIISYSNNIGKDLLDPDNSFSYDSENIKLFYLINGVKIEYPNSPNSDMPSGFEITKSERTGKHILTVSTYEGDAKDSWGNGKLINAISYLQLKDNVVDTIKCELWRADNSIITKKLWYNSVLKWQSESETPLEIEIIK